MSKYSLEDRYRLRKDFEMQNTESVMLNSEFNPLYVEKLEEKLLDAYKDIEALEYDLYLYEEDL